MPSSWRSRVGNGCTPLWLVYSRVEAGSARVPATLRRVVSSTLSATLSGDLVVGGVLSVVRTSMLEGDAGKLVELAPSLMAFIVAPYLGRAAAQAELEGKPSSLDSALMGAS